ncbi:hypothetical protein D9M70_318350 [compost metagenome]
MLCMIRLRAVTVVEGKRVIGPGLGPAGVIDAIGQPAGLLVDELAVGGLVQQLDGTPHHLVAELQIGSATAHPEQGECRLGKAVHVDRIHRVAVVAGRTVFFKKGIHVVGVALANTGIELVAACGIAQHAQRLQVVTGVKAVDELVMVARAIHPGAIGRLFLHGLASHPQRLRYQCVVAHLLAGKGAPGGAPQTGVVHKGPLAGDVRIEAAPISLGVQMGGDKTRAIQGDIDQGLVGAELPQLKKGPRHITGGDDVRLARRYVERSRLPVEVITPAAVGPLPRSRRYAGNPAIDRR